MALRHNTVRPEQQVRVLDPRQGARRVELDQRHGLQPRQPRATTTNWSAAATRAGAGTRSCRSSRGSRTTSSVRRRRAASAGLCISRSPMSWIRCAARSSPPEPPVGLARSPGHQRIRRRAHRLSPPRPSRTGAASAPPTPSSSRCGAGPTSPSPPAPPSIASSSRTGAPSASRSVAASGAAAVRGARREVIVSLGSMGSPKLLQLSGIGPREVLDAAGVPVVVGARERRAADARTPLLRGAVPAERRPGIQPTSCRAGCGQAATAARYALDPQGTDGDADLRRAGLRQDLARSAHGSTASCCWGPFTIPAYNEGEPMVIEREPGLSILGFALRPTSEGSVEITSS